MEVPAGKFRAKCHALMERVARTREAIVITKRGRPVAKLVPAENQEQRPPFFGYMAGKGEIRGDIMRVRVPEPAASSGEEDSLYDGLPTRSGNRVAESRPSRRKK